MDLKSEFEAAALVHIDAVYRTAIALCRVKDLGDDLVQTTFAKAFENFGSFKKGTNCKAWLIRILRNTWIDYLVRIFSIAGIAMPSFWLGILIILGLLIGTQEFFGEPWMPPIQFKPIWEDPVWNISQLIWPAVATGYRYSAVATRMTRSALLEVLREDYVRTARAKGLLEKVIINRHALKNALLPVVTIISIEFAFLMGGLVVTEQVFNLNGLGRLFVESVCAQDFNMTQQLVMLVVLIFVLTNFFVDILYAWLDPRIRYS